MCVLINFGAEKQHGGRSGHRHGVGADVGRHDTRASGALRHNRSRRLRRRESSFRHILNVLITSYHLASLANETIILCVLNCSELVDV